MHKELTANRALKELDILIFCYENIWDNKTYKHFRKCLDVIKNTLKQNEEEQIGLVEDHHDLNIKYCDLADKYEEQTKLLKIIKQKRVNVGNFIYWLSKESRTYELYLTDCYEEGWYLHYRDNTEDSYQFYKLTEEEFDLLTHYLSNELFKELVWNVTECIFKNVLEREVEVDE